LAPHATPLSGVTSNSNPGGLGLLSIEAAEAKKMVVEQLINDFSEIKARRKQF